MLIKAKIKYQKNIITNIIIQKKFLKKIQNKCINFNELMKWVNENIKYDINYFKLKKTSKYIYEEKKEFVHIIVNYIKIY